MFNDGAKKGSADFCELSISAIFVCRLTLIPFENQQLYSRRNGVRANPLIILELHDY